MEADRTKREIVETIREQIERSKDTHIWRDFVNALKLISQVVFTRSSGFILELVQNAEDAGRDSDAPGVFEICISKERLRVTHNGRPFCDEDVRSLCGIRSSKKPERGTLGYLGIGFKSVFKVTDCPEIYSGGFQFKFDRNHEAWRAAPGETPWHVIPIWLESQSEPVNDDRTTFIIPFREKTSHRLLVEDVKRLKTELYLFLRWLREIRVSDEVSGETWTLRNEGEDAQGITTLSQGGRSQKFKFFHAEADVPDSVKHDRLTQEYRANVSRRAVAIAFALDEQDNLDPSPLRAMYGGVYSFLPLGEAYSGVRFAIQADFLVQPGRDAINYEALWNHWLLDEVVRLCGTAMDFFRTHEKWRYQFLRVFTLDKSTKGLEPYNRLFGPKLIEPLEQLLKETHCALVGGGSWAKPDDVVRVEDDAEAVSALSAMGILAQDEVASVMAGEPGKQPLDPKVLPGSSELIKSVDRSDWFCNESFFQQKAQSAGAAQWFGSLYLWLQKYPSYEEYRKGRRTYRSPRRYDSVKFVLTADRKLSKGADVSIADLPPDDPLLGELSSVFQLPKPIVHPDVLSGARDEAERRAIRGFLTGLAGVQIYDLRSLCRDALLPKILTKSPKPSPDDLLRYTAHCCRYLGREASDGGDIWVLTKQGDIRSAKNVLLPAEFKPETNWESNQRYLPGLSFLSERYLADVKSNEELKAWRDFMRVLGVREAPDNGIEELAVNFAVECLESRYTKVIRVEKLNYGYDLEAESAEGEKAQFEVKGQSGEEDVTLTGNETEAADKYRESYHLCVVSGVPEHPKMYLLANPSLHGKKDKLTIPAALWKTAQWP